MITLFEKFGDPFKMSNYIKKDKDGTFKIPHVHFDNVNENALNYATQQLMTSDKGTEIKYNSLMRFFLYIKFLRYSGNSPMIKLYAEGLKNKDKEKEEIINKIPNNNMVLRMINKIYGYNYPTYSFDNLVELKKFILNWEKVLNDRNLVEFINNIYEISLSASKSEKVVKGVLSMLYSKYYELTYSKIKEDLKGMDLWKINKTTGERQSIQVKNIKGKTIKFTLKDDVIFINNTGIDLKDYKGWEGRLPYDYLAFYIEAEEKIYIIKSTAIFTIDKNLEKKYIKIKFKDWAMDPKFYSKVIKEVFVPKKLIGKDLSQIFYTPEIESEIQLNNPDVLD